MAERSVDGPPGDRDLEDIFGADPVLVLWHQWLWWSGLVCFLGWLAYVVTNQPSQ